MRIKLFPDDMLPQDKAIWLVMFSVVGFCISVSGLWCILELLEVIL